MRLMAPRLAPDFDLRDIYGKRRRLRYLRGRRVMVSFFPDLACASCDLRIAELSHNSTAWKEAGLEVIAFFKASSEDIRRYVANHRHPFTIVGDEEMTVYERYGVEHSFMGILRGKLLRMPRRMRVIFEGFMPGRRGSQTLLPADFLVDDEGTIRAVYYGHDIGDHLPLDAIRAFIAQGQATPCPTANTRLRPENAIRHSGGRNERDGLQTDQAGIA